MDTDNLAESVTIKSAAPEDVLRAVEREQRAELIRNDKMIQESIRGEKERALLQKRIYDIANPSPILVTLIIVVVILIVYLVYLILLKPCLSGEWIDKAGNVWNISQNKLSGDFNVNVNGKFAGAGYVLDNYVKYGDLVGVWNYQNIVAFMDGWYIERVL